MIYKFSFLYMFFSHLFAYSYGSIQRPQRSAFIVRIPFYSEVMSEGRPFMFHDFITMGSPIILSRSNVSEHGIFLSIASALQASVSYFL